MRIAVIGAGGTGGLYGALLARAGHDVSFLARGMHLDAMRSRGLRVESAEFGTFTVTARAASDAADLAVSDLVIFAVKTYDLDAAAPQASQLLSPDGRLLTLQNGVEAPDQIAAVVGAERVQIGTTRLETTILEPGVIGHLSPMHLVTVSPFDGPPSEREHQTVDVLRAAGIKAELVEDGRRALWEKAAMLVPMATITSVTRSAIGPVRDLPETRELTVALLAEIAAVARALGVDVEDSQSRAALSLMSVPPSMKASMARDFERGGRTELEALTGAVVRLADRHGVPVPATRTAYALLKLRAQLETPETSVAGAR